MENKNSKIGLTAFLMLIVASTEMYPILKYIMLFLATISFIVTATQIYEEHKAKKISAKLTNQNKS
jgi:hypothetical protein